MNKKYLIFILIILVMVSGCHKEKEVTNEEEERLTETRLIADDFMGAYTRKDGGLMNRLASDRYSITDEEISYYDKAQEVNMNVIGTNLSYSYQYHQGNDDTMAYVYRLFEKQPIGSPLDQFTIKVELKKTEDIWLVDDIFLEYD